MRLTALFTVLLASVAVAGGSGDSAPLRTVSWAELKATCTSVPILQPATDDATDTAPAPAAEPVRE